ncbi:hypothetical protein JK359_16360 [Streptomyces actinomycinicus]|uniref:Uncharacterized protein n=1 Tax=Streptomyces actinomycinicus TaxID=1695166 RepID=A0A937EJB4_9ACTN|nr:hypothetical protein [Streptomyces actinomycinicus]MBL1083528.1 hypothetical protein [Streptomyces actinomycinicus]
MHLDVVISDGVPAAPRQGGAGHRTLQLQLDDRSSLVDAAGPLDHPAQWFSRLAQG